MYSVSAHIHRHTGISYVKECEKENEREQRERKENNDLFLSEDTKH